MPTHSLAIEEALDARLKVGCAFRSIGKIRNARVVFNHVLKAAQAEADRQPDNHFWEIAQGAAADELRKIARKEPHKRPPWRRDKSAVDRERDGASPS